MNCVIRAEDAIWRKIEDQVVIVEDDGCSVHVLNKTAAQIWEMCDGGVGVTDIASKICERFEVSPDEALADVEQTVSKLKDLGLLKMAGEAISQ